jgi:hypothetical protein
VVDRFVVGEPVPQPVKFGNWPLDVLAEPARPCKQAGVHGLPEQDLEVT